jgi:hypothetical protein
MIGSNYLKSSYHDSAEGERVLRSKTSCSKLFDPVKPWRVRPKFKQIELNYLELPDIRETFASSSQTILHGDISQGSSITL